MHIRNMNECRCVSKTRLTVQCRERASETVASKQAVFARDKMQLRGELRSQQIPDGLKIVWKHWS